MCDVTGGRTDSAASRTRSRLTKGTVNIEMERLSTGYEHCVWLAKFQATASSSNLDTFLTIGVKKPGPCFEM